MNKGKVQVTFLPDGRVKVETGSFAGPEHAAAEKFIAILEDLLGGEVETTKAEKSHHHHHHHEHAKQ